MILCSINDCGKKVHGLKFCNLHYKRFKRYGDPHISFAHQRKYFTLEDRFLNSFVKRGQDECWIWHASFSRGYGAMCWNKKRYDSHRFSYEYYKSKIPMKMCVCHKCDNPPCVNPNHLFLGTKSDNTLDMISKNRQRKGEETNLNKINEKEVLQIKIRLQDGEKARTLAKEFKLSESQISRIKKGIRWSHIDISSP